MLAELGGQLFRDNFGVILVCNSNLGLINSGVLFVRSIVRLSKTLQLVSRVLVLCVLVPVPV